MSDIGPGDVVEYIGGAPPKCSRGCCSLPLTVGSRYVVSAVKDRGEPNIGLSGVTVIHGRVKRPREILFPLRYFRKIDPSKERDILLWLSQPNMPENPNPRKAKELS